MALHPEYPAQPTKVRPADGGNKSETMVRAAWLYFIENMTQQEIAECLGISRIKVLRLIKEAYESGIVEIKIKSPIADSLKLESELRLLYGLTHVVVTITQEDGDALYKVLAWSGAQILEQRLRPGIKIGVGEGRTTYNLIDYFAPKNQVDCTFISLAGGLNRAKNVEDSYETLLKLSRQSGGSARYIYAPFLVSSPEIRDSILQDKAVESVINQAKNSDLAIFSVGTPDDFALLHQYNFITTEEMSEIRKLGALGDVLGRFFDQSGQELMTSYHDRVIGLSIDELRAIPLRILLAGGQKKYQAIRATLTGKIANILVTDIKTAEWLISNAKE